MVNALGSSGRLLAPYFERYHLNLSFVNDAPITVHLYELRPRRQGPHGLLVGVRHVGRYRSSCRLDYRLILANDRTCDRFGIVCGTDGMITTANAFLEAVALTTS